MTAEEIKMLEEGKINELVGQQVYHVVLTSLTDHVILTCYLPQTAVDAEIDAQVKKCFCVCCMFDVSYLSNLLCMYMLCAVSHGHCRLYE